ncbi:MAG: hypothetical protein ACI3XF_07320 [Eubacteriales bacterium]
MTIITVFPPPASDFPVVSAVTDVVFVPVTDSATEVVPVVSAVPVVTVVSAVSLICINKLLIVY